MTAPDDGTPNTLAHDTRNAANEEQQIRDNLATKYDHMHPRTKELLADAELAPAEIPEADIGRWQDTAKMMKSQWNALDNARAVEKAPYDRAAATVHNFFLDPMGRIEAARKSLAAKVTTAKEKLKERLQREAEEEARRKREEAERVRLQKEAELRAKREEEERKAAEAERIQREAREAEERKIAEAQARQRAAEEEQRKIRENRERAEREAREAEERAERARKEETRRKAEEEAKAKQAEADRLAAEEEKRRNPRMNRPGSITKSAAHPMTTRSARRQPTATSTRPAGKPRAPNGRPTRPPTRKPRRSPSRRRSRMPMAASSAARGEISGASARCARNGPSPMWMSAPSTSKSCAIISRWMAMNAPSAR